MSSNEEFDELARRKLAERDFPFQEAHWLDAQRALAAQRKDRRGGALWIAGGALAVLLGTWLFWPSNEGSPLSRLEEGTTARPMEADAAAHEQANGSGTAISTTTEVGSEVQPSTIDQVASTTVEPEKTAPTSEDHAKARRDRIPARKDLRDGSAAGHSPVAVVSATPAAAPGRTSTDLAQGTLAQPGDGMPPPALDAMPSILPPDLLLAPPPNMRAAPNDGPEHHDVAQKGEHAPGSDMPTTTDHADAVVHTDTTGANANRLPALVPSTDPAALLTDPIAGATASMGSDTAQTPPATNDLNTAPPVAAAIPPLIGARSPWELAALFGAFNTTSTYTGGSSASWNMSPERTYGGGAEMVRMGRNVGLGLGIHYGTYTDRLRTPGESRSELSTTRSWFLDPVDTTILIVTGFDTATGFFTTQNINVTINQLRMTLDSSYATVVIREARERINRTSYVEAVGLLDAHLVQGRWSFGVRGGPSIGLLSTSSGSIPSNGAEEITFKDAAMQRFVLGWTARAYVRYRFNAAWSVGLEPAARGQLGDAFVQDSITRRSTAIGGMISVSYRLP